MTSNHGPLIGIDPKALRGYVQEELQRFAKVRPRSAELSRQGAQHLLFGVPLHWMADWGTPFALHVASAQGVDLVDADGHHLTDFCLGDTGAMFGHSPPPVVEAVAQQAGRGITTMLPSADAGVVAALLSDMFGLSHWQFALSASDANRFLLRWMRAITGRDKVLVFNGCYHGTVDDAFVDLTPGGPKARASLLGQVQDLTHFTRVVEFNDLEALEQALKPGDVACVLAEPAMTNVGMVLPQPGFWEQAMPMIRRHEAALIFDETHTISTGWGGYGRVFGLTPDALVLGKPLGGGLPCAAYGLSQAWAERAMAAKHSAPPGHSGIGTTLSGNMLGLAAMRANLSQVMTKSAYAHMVTMADSLSAGLRDVVKAHNLPWTVPQLGARIELQGLPSAPINGSMAMGGFSSEWESALHLGLLNRGSLITPFHTMMLLSPVTTASHTEQLRRHLDEVLIAIKNHRSQT